MAKVISSSFGLRSPQLSHAAFAPAEPHFMEN